MPMAIRSARNVVILTNRSCSAHFRATLLQLKQDKQLPSTLNISAIDEIQTRGAGDEEVIDSSHCNEVASEIKTLLDAGKRVVVDGNRKDFMLF